MTDTLFDCPTCHDARARITELEREVAWLRRRVKVPACERCTHGAGLCGYTTRYGFELAVCVGCWRPGDTFELRPEGWGLTVTVVDHLVLDLHTSAGDVRIECYDTDTGWGRVDWGDGRVETFKVRDFGPTWAKYWRATGAVELSGRGGGVMCRADAVRTVIANLGRTS